MKQNKKAPNRHNLLLDSPQLLSKRTRMPVVLWETDRGLDFFATDSPDYYRPLRRCIDILEKKNFDFSPPTPLRGHALITTRAIYDACSITAGTHSLTVSYIDASGAVKTDIVDRRDVVKLMETN